MAKAKKKGPKPKSEIVKKVNPFELKFNKKKHNVLGQKQNAGIMGRPGLSKKKAHEKRENTLGVDYSRVGVVNKVVDRRLGENDTTKTDSEKISMRFAAERMKNYKKDKFNLTDDNEILTHGGEALTAIQKYDRVRESDDEDEGDNIAASIVRDAHFGGGADSKGKSRHDIIADIIAKTKQSRLEKTKAKDEQEAMTDNLDEKYRKLLGKVSATFRPVGTTKVENEGATRDDFDTLMYQMKFDADQKATPAERMKTEEEKAADEKAHLEELEQCRIARMNAQENGKRHLPVDVDVNPNAVSKKKKADFELRFDSSGKVLNKNKIEKNSLRKVAIDSDVSDEEADPDDDDDEDLDDLIDGRVSDEASDEEEEEAADEDDEEEVEDEEEEAEESEGEEKEVIDSKDIEIEVKENGEIPFTFEFPANYNALAKILNGYGSNNVGIVLERIVKCHHPGLKQGNKDLMKKLFLYTLRFYEDKSKNITEESVKTLGILSKSLYAIMKFNVEYGVRCIRAFTRQLWKERSDKKKGNKPASFTVISLLRLVAILFPVDHGTMWHPATAPVFMLATSCLSKGMVTSLSALAQQILLLSTIADYIQEAKSYTPEAMGFIQGALTLTVDKPEFLAPSNCFPISEPHCKMLLIRETVTSEDATKPLKLTEIYGNKVEENDINRCRVLRVLLANIKRFQVLYMVHEDTYTTLFTPIVNLMKRIPASLLPAQIAEELEVIIKSTEAECQAKSKQIQLSRIKTEKSMLKMLEPRFEEDFNPERRRGKTSQGSAKEKQKLQYLYKKEMRGAIKELRKDTAYLGRKQRQETAFKDRDRRQKTKRLMASLASQQGEWNKEMQEGGGKKKFKK